MYINEKHAKIYSRGRLQLFNEKHNSSNLINDKGKIHKKRNKLYYVIVVILIAIITVIAIINAINPIIDKLCFTEAENIATKISNEQATIVMKEYKYDDLIEVTKDSNDNVKMVQTNTANINKIISDIPLKIQQELKKSDNTNINFKLGSIFGLKSLSGLGPNIRVKISNIGKVETNLKSEFLSQGINQTIHRIYLEINCEVTILTPIHTISQNILNQILIAETIIVGDIPNSYYNLQGISSTDSTKYIGK